MADNEDQENLTSSSDDDDDSTSSSSSTSTDDDDDEQVDDESDDNLSSLTPKQTYLTLENKRKTLGKRLLELRDELKAQPQADIDTKKRLLTEIKNVREKWIAVQTRLTNVKARLSHSPTPERKVVQKPPVKKPVEEVVQPGTRIIPPPRVRTSNYSTSSRSRSSSRDSTWSTDKPYRDLDALNDNSDSKIRDTLSARPTTSYRDLTDDRQLSSRAPTSYRDLADDHSLSSPPSVDQLPLEDFATIERRLSDDNLEVEDEISNPTETFYNQNIPYPVINDKRDLEVINRQLKNQLRGLEASKNNPLYDKQSNLVHYERLKKQNEYINIKLRIEKLKKSKTKTQREKEQSKKQFHQLIQDFRKLQRFMRSANRDASRNVFFAFDNESFASSIPLPASPEVKQQQQQQQEKQIQPKQEVEPPLPPIDLHRVTGKKTVFESSDSDDEEEEPASEPQVPVSLSASEPRAVPDGFIQNQPPPLPLPTGSGSSLALDAIKNRVANLINTPSTPASQTKESNSATKVEADDEDDDDDDDDNPPPVLNPERNQAISAKFNRRRRKTKRNRKKKNANNSQTAQQITDENEPTMIDQEEAWKRHIALQIQSSFLKGSNPILRALTTEAYKKLGINQEELNEFQFDDEIMDYETALILQQQQEFLAAAAANPFNVLHNAAAGSSSSRPNLVDILSNLNGGFTPSSSEPQTPMGLLQKFFLDANNNSNAKHLSNRNLNDLSTTPPTPPPPRDISIGKKIVESLTHQDINALLKLSGSEHDDDDDDDDENQSFDADTDDETNNFSIDEDSNDLPNGTNKNYERWERPTPISSRSTQSSNINNKKSAIETLILPSFNRCTHLGKSTKRSAGVERMFPSFSKHNNGPSSTLSLILYGLSSTP